MSEVYLNNPLLKKAYVPIEWTAEEVRQRDEIPDETEVKIFPLVKDYSTTGVLEKIRQIETHEKTNKSD